MDGSNVQKLKKAVVSLQKLDLLTQSSKSCKGVPSESGGSEDAISENATLDSADSNVGCTDDDDLEKKIQAFSIPVKKDEQPIDMNHPNSSSSIAKEKNSSISEKCKDVHSKHLLLDLKTSKVKTDKINSEREKLAQNKTASEKDKLPLSKIVGDKEKKTCVSPGKTSGDKEHPERNSKAEEFKSNKSKQGTDASLHKQRKRKHSIDCQSLEEPNLKHTQIKHSKGNTPEISTPSTSKMSISTDFSKSSNAKKNRHDSVNHTTVRKTPKLMSSGDKKPKEKNEDSKENKKYIVNDNKERKEIVKDKNPISKLTSNEKNTKIKYKKSEHMSKNGSVKREDSSSSHEKKSKTLNRNEQGVNPFHKEKQHKKTSNDRDEKYSSEDLKLKHIASSKESKNINLPEDSKKSKNNSLVKKSVVNKDKKHGSKMIVRNPASSASHSLGHSMEMKSKRFKNGAKLIPKENIKISNKKKSLISDVKNKSNKNAGKSKAERKETLHKHRRLLHRLEHSIKNSKVKSENNLENEGSVDLVHDDLSQETHMWDKSFLRKQLFKTVSKKSDKLPSENIGTESYKKLWKWSHYIRMPANMWSLHKHPNGDYVMILHIAEISSTPKIIIDKCVQFKGNAFPVVKLYNKEVPLLQTTAELQTLGEVCSFLKQIDTLSLCDSLKDSLDRNISNCEMFTNSNVTLPFICKHCKNSSAREKSRKI